MMNCELKFKKLQKKKDKRYFQLTNLKLEETKNAYKERTVRAIMETYNVQISKHTRKM